ncbi:hypothetical protein C8R32_12213 [Nitrosospira sp. Nsp5]|uniref:Lipoprotein n=1 Tax=Nitrosospira multiformis TaxID=1231 RepID=A0ABY0TIT4_9PROT|nr:MULTISPECIES: hypothetical protein [Nitrosospira]PTR05406.1 hypothetical protein C8R32_12213 [Nitrosospira sp. Nsp5]SDQ90357.1 hypothetical protein SAMN05216402_2758 [Nitrosospira multiformis]
MATTLGKKTKDIFTTLSLFGLLAACALMSTSVRGENIVGHAAIGNVTNPSEHNVLAKQFEDAAREMQIKANEQKELLEQYENGHLYGWQSHNLKSNTLALIRRYEQAARSNMKEAASHRQMAQKAKHNYAIHGGLRSDSAFGEALRVENN